MIIQISKHAKEKMDVEGIDEEQIKRAIKMGSITRQMDGYLLASLPVTLRSIALNLSGFSCASRILMLG